MMNNKKWSYIGCAYFLVLGLIIAKSKHATMGVAISVDGENAQWAGFFMVAIAIYGMILTWKWK